MKPLDRGQKKKSFFQVRGERLRAHFPVLEKPLLPMEPARPTVKSTDPFYKEKLLHGRLRQNLKTQLLELVKPYGDWKPPKKPKLIPAMKGSGHELIGGESREPHRRGKKLPLKEQEKLLKEEKNPRIFNCSKISF